MLMKKKKVYEKPAMQVYELREEPRLLQTSGNLPGMPGYTPGNDPLNPTP